jgi:ornithine carbamoyltransferase
MTTPRHFIDLPDLSPEILHGILKHAHELKRQKFNPPQIFSGLSLAMVFDKRSTRTRMSFEVAMKQLGGHTIVMNRDDMQIGGAESLQDTAHVLSRYVDAVMLRVSHHEDVQELARHSRIPVINGLTDHSHPCQIMADMMTIEEKLGRIKGLKIVWLGDVNNVTRTFAQASTIWDFELTIACPPDLAPAAMPATIVHDARAAVSGAHVIVTDTWVSMGQEGKDIDKFWPYQVTPELMAKAAPDAIFMHCMPIHRGEEVTDTVLNSQASVIYDEAENRLHAQKAILAWCLQNAGVRID